MVRYENIPCGYAQAFQMGVDGVTQEDGYQPLSPSLGIAYVPHDRLSVLNYAEHSFLTEGARQRRRTA